VLDEAHRRVSNLVVERLEATHPGDDDNVYFLGAGGRYDLVQVDTRDRGQPPFLIEADGEAHRTSDPTQAATTVVRLLGGAGGVAEPPRLPS
jgi:hypothetical protein